MYMKVNMNAYIKKLPPLCLKFLYFRIKDNYVNRLHIFFT